mmetsp:Transcript_44111/g.116702  ORF Transcript_44111/g.116702 Transcript_44111/m.116702 type:complete len:208 (+) Transcript_44111:1911-2534(+)
MRLPALPRPSSPVESMPRLSWFTSNFSAVWVQRALRREGVDPSLRRFTRNGQPCCRDPPICDGKKPLPASYLIDGPSERMPLFVVHAAVSIVIDVRQKVVHLVAEARTATAKLSRRRNDNISGTSNLICVEVPVEVFIKTPKHIEANLFGLIVIIPDTEHCCSWAGWCNSRSNANNTERQRSTNRGLWHRVTAITRLKRREPWACQM